MPVTGKGRRKILVVAEAPGKEEDKRGEQLVGDAGTLLRRHLKRFGIDLDRDCWKTNALICRPPGNEVRDKYVESCRPNLLKTVRELKPATILLLGGTAVKSLLAVLWGSDPGLITKWVGWQIPSRRWNAWICPTYHPSYLLRSGDEGALSVVFDRHLKALNRIDDELRPIDRYPDCQSAVRVIVDPKEAAERVDGIRLQGWPVAFDYETTGLKPEPEWAEIVSCAVSTCEITIAYPWVGEAIEATSRLLKSDVPKVAHNAKFEERWTRVKLGHRVRNWRLCTMNMAHLLDNRKEITSLNFQAFVNLGVEPYGTHVSPFLKATGERQPNRIREIPLRDLLLYNGMDALMCRLLAEKQMKEMKGNGNSP